MRRLERKWTEKPYRTSPLPRRTPPIGGFRTWPQIRNATPNKSDIIHKITNPKIDIKKAIKATKDNKTKAIFGILLQEARDTGIDFNIQAYSRAPYKYKRDSYEVA
jgi:hypothetical protein